MSYKIADALTLLKEGTGHLRAAGYLIVPSQFEEHAASIRRELLADGNPIVRLEFYQTTPHTPDHLREYDYAEATDRGLLETPTRTENELLMNLDETIRSVLSCTACNLDTRRFDGVRVIAHLPTREIHFMVIAPPTAEGEEGDMDLLIRSNRAMEA